jgi:ribonuclease I
MAAYSCASTQDEIGATLAAAFEVQGLWSQPQIASAILRADERNYKPQADRFCPAFRQARAPPLRNDVPGDYLARFPWHLHRGPL